MAEIGIIPSSLAEALSAPHVVFTILADLQFASGRMRLHPGGGTLVVDGEEWFGVTDPGGLRAVSISSVPLDGYTLAARVDIVMTGVDLEFLKGVRRVVTENHREVEGRRADLYLVFFDPGTQTPIGGAYPFFIDGRMSAPGFTAEGAGMRKVRLSIEGVGSAKNFAPGGRQTSASQRHDYPGQVDEIYEYVGGKLGYRWPK